MDGRGAKYGRPLRLKCRWGKGRCLCGEGWTPDMGNAVIGEDHGPLRIFTIEIGLRPDSVSIEETLSKVIHVLLW